MNSLQERINIAKIDWCQINILYYHQNQLKTTIGTGNIGSKKINYTQNTITWSGNIYPYYTTEKECSSKYHEHGICDKTTGTCKCNSEYTGFDCSSPINNNNNNNQAETETETNNNGTVIIKNQVIGYSISIQL
ncbi:hypothetical protein DICPUDRAFT_74797 [Dictyostelium purpureum]|uniref:EGF-like domain-containing protein n=1 Tax=Dictyostelium purpureum TaxID=5786 RepID=F0Z8S1_DICPU|nr:uncharacterized protein DICPUDRAFT_74797 [Dictyostelium purpureum]EGC39708.1 hypothetical protein DICPUDRAFT_74797 [Dictyostelium purpureum]|eukprot:XP_003283817.1 hypothetical protein DICPUDRAFT_74797 [Dictyostelium purpureum]